MVRGRKPAPTALKLVKGEQKSRINNDEPQPEDGVPQCPSLLPAVREVWDYTVAQLRTMRVLTMADRDMLAAYCEAVVMHREASRIIARDGMLLHDGNGAYKNPATLLQREAANAIKAFGTEFGLSPSARTRIKVGDQQPEREQGSARLLSG
jgi:P27 family predicted phage terminase small subunit